jgi:hypothetical protein
VTADLRADAADAALNTLARLRVPAEDIALLRLDRIAPVGRRPNRSPWYGQTCWDRRA